MPFSAGRVASVAALAAVGIALAGCAGDPVTVPPGDATQPSSAAASSAPPTKTPTPDPTLTPAPALTSPSPTPPVFDRSARSIDDPASLWVVVNKTRPLVPANYQPPDLVSVPVAYANPPLLRAEAADAVVAMFDAFAAETGLAMQSQSAYRGYSAQVRVYDGWVASLGRDGADLTSARAGYSEHQTGLAIDISAKPAVCSLDQCFADTPQGEWLAAHAWQYGFILRYPEGLTAVTGYEFEPWHYRYVGLELARDYHDSGAETLEAYFGLPAAPDYLD